MPESLIVAPASEEATSWPSGVHANSSKKVRQPAAEGWRTRTPTAGGIVADAEGVAVLEGVRVIEGLDWISVACKILCSQFNKPPVAAVNPQNA